MSQEESAGSSRRSSRKPSSSGDVPKTEIDYFELYRNYPCLPNKKRLEQPQSHVSCNIQSNPLASLDTEIDTDGAKSERDTFTEAPSSPYRLNRYSARTYLDVSPPGHTGQPGFDVESSELYSQRREFFLRPPEERYLEKRPPPVRHFSEVPKRSPRSSPTRQRQDFLNLCEHEQERPGLRNHGQEHYGFWKQKQERSNVHKQRQDRPDFLTQRLERSDLNKQPQEQSGFHTLERERHSLRKQGRKLPDLGNRGPEHSDFRKREQERPKVPKTVQEPSGFLNLEQERPGLRQQTQERPGLRQQTQERSYLYKQGRERPDLGNREPEHSDFHKREQEPSDKQWKRCVDFLKQELKCSSLGKQWQKRPELRKEQPESLSSEERLVAGFINETIDMDKLDEHERNVIVEFCHLLEKSKQLFNGLRELPPYGHKLWHTYFGRTFDVYTKLWKFQQQHRSLLDSKYRLKRWQIGEIASKIGQLYYHFYSRTSNTNYLYEAFAFYNAIRGRSYYTQANKEDKCELMVKKLRYYARFIATAILLKKARLATELIRELDKQIVEYGKAYNPDDQGEWIMVVEEIKDFIRTEPTVTVLHPDGVPVILTHRLTPKTTPPIDRTPDMTLSLEEVLIIGSNPAQVKFSELTVDMYRILQTLEREPCGDIQHTYDDSPQQRQSAIPSAVNRKGCNFEIELCRGDNPHKCLLFKPTTSQILVNLANACVELPPNGVLLVYISAEGYIVQPQRQTEDYSYEVGGVITTSRNDLLNRETIKDGKPVPNKRKEVQVLHPGDLYAFTRKPMFLIVESSNSVIFSNMPRHFGQPLVILMSPLEVPANLHAVDAATETRKSGNLLTLFLHCPLSAFCHCCGINTMSLKEWQKAQHHIQGFMEEASLFMTRTRPDNMYMVFMGDDYLRLLILRFIFCETFLRLSRAFRSRAHRTRCSPPLPDELFEHPPLVQFILSLAANLQVRNVFLDQGRI